MYPLLIKILNVIAYLCFLSTNLYSGLGPQNDKSPYSDTRPTYITPAAFTFGVWVFIHLLLGCFVIYQFFTPAGEVVIDGIHWHFISISLWNTAWLALWTNDLFVLSWVAIVITGCQVSHVYWTLKRKYPPHNVGDKLLIHFPFSLYHAWIAVVFILSTFVAFSPEKLPDQDPSLFVKVLVFLGLLFLGMHSIFYAEQIGGDVSGSIVIAWSLFGIAAGQEDAFIHWSAIVIGTISTLYILKPFVFKYFLRRSGEESEVLLPH
ncbi:8458_t:CDS:2 [Cetraspora pellucida]|uniref:8458_t:CDS:1 n=1 Tax=Cetraspora pellucida TaxID=1433469 RepID=A0A9N9B7I8_9GLOM|nr:8458_t:CDS:2 [Cetraspora pellucida]